jgi:alkanesulfonate monooxygenase SsuD/methylene tetrahydromethanopterin reductase-like flavin-dependent oxidoreductase (luciferase family)
VRVGISLARDERHHAGDACRGENLGFDVVSVGEHLFFHGPTPNAFIALAAAGATERIRLVSSLTIVPVYPAALLAKLVAGLDLVSNRRLYPGAGVGGEYAPEFEAPGVKLASRGARTDETLGLLRELFTGEPVDFTGRFSRVPGLRL